LCSPKNAGWRFRIGRVIIQFRSFYQRRKTMKDGRADLSVPNEKSEIEKLHQENNKLRERNQFLENQMEARRLSDELDAPWGKDRCG